MTKFYTFKNSPSELTETTLLTYFVILRGEFDMEITNWNFVKNRSPESILVYNQYSGAQISFGKDKVTVKESMPNPGLSASTYETTYELKHSNNQPTLSVSIASIKGEVRQPIVTMDFLNLDRTYDLRLGIPKDITEEIIKKVELPSRTPTTQTAQSQSPKPCIIKRFPY